MALLKNVMTEIWLGVCDLAEWIGCIIDDMAVLFGADSDNGAKK